VLAASFGRKQLRKQFRESFAQARFHTAWTRSGHSSPEGEAIRISDCHRPSAEVPAVAACGKLDVLARNCAESAVHAAAWPSNA